jgi:hypothetical protein
MTKHIPIPEAREELYQLADTYGLPRLAEIADGMKRRPPARRRAPRSAPEITPSLIRQVRIYAKNHPDEPMNKIGEVHGINQGRVSEILNGLR